MPKALIRVPNKLQVSHQPQTEINTQDHFYTQGRDFPLDANVDKRSPVTLLPTSPRPPFLPLQSGLGVQRDSC